MPETPLRSLHPASIGASRVALLANQDKRPKILTLAKPVCDAPHTGQRQAILMRHLTQIIVAALRATSTILQKQIGHIPTLPSAESRTVCDMRPAFRRGWVGEGKPKSMPWRGPAGAQATATRGRLFRFREREGKALGVTANQDTEAVSLPQPRRGTGTAPLHGATPPDEVRAGRAPAPIRQGKRQECQRVSSKTPHPQEREARDRARPQTLPLNILRSRSSPEWAGTKGPVRARG
jgi:hypothetical protein